MAIEIKCKLLDKLPVQSGTSARGAWCKQDFIVETIEQYPRKICMNVWGDDKVKELANYNSQDMLNVSINIESREFNGRWYTDVRAWKIQKDMPAGAEQANAVDPFVSPVDFPEGDDSGDLPF
ncbi:MAG: DUF3127 domain-containing protein [Bacteroidales bacterium]|jgi:hypothetical protein|nr:DUF3127 domain-containing protein [Bacteroidales bacterium]MBO7305527.1 DUF3127 domain-containing protein [Bacteroidales bacterium]MBQ1218673.1 DUF3127 domain-containing protein [Bacteroidales bacterium]MBQ5783527.1 DUF3127 domain-containing protein [Bacteroidales bacterium]MBQ5864775.1 DUF3127 domain-containing protein [Bacteroidales bacterium]